MSFPPAPPSEEPHSRSDGQAILPANNTSAAFLPRFPQRSDQSSETESSPETTPVRPSPVPRIQAPSGPGVDETEREGKASTVRIDEQSKIYTFLTTLTSAKLKSTCAAYGERTGGNKATLITRTMLLIKLSEMDGKDVCALMRNNADLSSYTAFAAPGGDCERLWTLVPSVEQLCSFLTGRERKYFQNAFLTRSERQNDRHMVDIESGERNPPNFSLNEFARLFVLLRDDEIAKTAAGHALHDELNRVELEYNVTRDSYWKIVERRFNDTNVRSRIDLSGRVDEVNADENPLVFRPAGKLREAFAEGRRVLQIPKRRWEASGQNDPSKFVNFLRVLANGDLEADSKKAYIVFTICRLGTPHVDESFLRLFSRVIDNDAGYDEGMLDLRAVALHNGSSSIAPPSSNPSSQGSKRKRHSNASIELGMKMADNTQAIGFNCKVLAETSGERLTLMSKQFEYQKDLDNRRLDVDISREEREKRREERQERLDLLQEERMRKRERIEEARERLELHKMLREAKANIELAESEGDAGLIVLAQRSFETLRSQYELMLHNGANSGTRFGSSGDPRNNVNGAD